MIVELHVLARYVKLSNQTKSYKHAHILGLKFNNGYRLTAGWLQGSPL
jgi:hypothetical protein